MHKISKEKFQRLENLSNENKIISALAIDQRDSMRTMFSDLGVEADADRIKELKALLSKNMTPYASSILLDTEYGLLAARERDDQAGLILAYEVSGYDKEKIGRFPQLLDSWSALRLKEAGADAVKILLYFDIDDMSEINERKQAFVERVGSECQGEDLPFFLEIITYDDKFVSTKSKEFAEVKPRKVIEAMKLFSADRYKVDVLKVEVPVNMQYVEGYSEDGDILYSRQEALDYFKDQSDATHLPYIFLSAGVSASLFQETLRFAKEADARFNGVLCGRSNWKGSVPIFVHEGEDQARDWIKITGMNNIQTLNEVVDETAQAWSDKIEAL